MTAAPLLLDYKAADHEIARFHASKSPVRALLGGRGSTKSSAALMEVFRAASSMPPGLDGVRRSRALFIRASYPAILKSMLATCVNWLGAAPGFSVRHSTPPTISVKTPLADGTTMDFEILFLSVPDIASLQNLRGIEASTAWIDEVVETPMEVLAAVSGCLGRYPGRNTFAPEHTTDANGRPKAPFSLFTVLTTNPGQMGSPWHRFYDRPPEDVEVFTQPGAYEEYTPAQAEQYLTEYPHLAPHAIERFSYVYLPNPRATFVRCISQGFGYWRAIILAASDRSEVLQLVCSKWATSKAGLPVWPSWSDDLHLAKTELEPDYQRPLLIGLDHSGLAASAVFGQMSGNQLLIFEAFCPGAEDGSGTSFEEFLDEHLLPALQARYSGMKVQVVLDPAISRDQLRGRTVVEALLDVGLSSVPAPTNNPQVRIGSVAKRLMRKGGIVISRSPLAQTLLDAMRGGYVFASAPDGSPKAAAKKDKHSHPADALTYLSTHLDIGGRTNASAAGRSKLAGRGSIAR